MAKIFDTLGDGGKNSRKNFRGKIKAEVSQQLPTQEKPPEPVNEPKEEMSFVEFGPEGYYRASADVLAFPLEEELVSSPQEGGAIPTPVPLPPQKNDIEVGPEESPYSRLLDQLLKDFPSPNEGTLLFVTLPSVRRADSVFQLAKVAANQGEVVLVETQGKGFSGVQSSDGWLEILEGKAEIEDCLKDSGITGLRVITAGKTHSGKKDGIKLFSRSPRAALRSLRRGYRLVFIDGGVWSEEASGLGLARECDGVCLLVPSAKVGSTMVEEILARIEDSGIHLAGLLVLPGNSLETITRKAA